MPNLSVTSRRGELGWLHDFCTEKAHQDKWFSDVDLFLCFCQDNISTITEYPDYPSTLGYYSFSPDIGKTSEDSCVPIPRVKSWRHLFKVMYLGVIACPDEKNNIDGKILIKRAITTPRVQQNSHSQRFNQKTEYSDLVCAMITMFTTCCHMSSSIPFRKLFMLRTI